jgi:hypothetical protein
MQIRGNREINAESVAWAAAAQHQMTLSMATMSMVEHYVETHNFGDPKKPTIEQFCKDMNGGKTLGSDEIFQDPLTGGKACIVSMGDGTFMATPDHSFPPRTPMRFAEGLWQIKTLLEMLFWSSWMVLCFCAICGAFESRYRNFRLGVSPWLVCTSASLTTLGFLRTPPENDAWWGLRFLVFSGLYWAWTLLFGREIDPTPRCRKCRYNLTGNQSGVCPECGTLLIPS